jgi:hypothetical protein
MVGGSLVSGGRWLASLLAGGQQCLAGKGGEGSIHGREDGLGFW